MHDVDRTLLEFEGTYGEMSPATAGSNEVFEAYEAGPEQGFLGEFGEAQETNGFLGEAFETYETEGEGESFLGELSGEGVFDEVTEMELAAELLELNNEQELEQFLGKLLKKAASVAGNIVKGPIGQTLMPMLKKAAKVALPVAGAALGNLVVPGIGGAIGGKLASAAGSMFGLELEGLSTQDREFEVARRYVRFAGTAARQMARTPTTVPVSRAARTATITAARRHIPGLLRPRTVAAVNNVIRQAARQGSRGGYRPRPGYRPGVTYGAPTYYGAQADGDGNGYGGNADIGVEGPSYGDGTSGATRSGRWYRRGRKIVLVGL